MLYRANCGNSSFTLSASDISEALNYAVKRFDDDLSHTHTVSVEGNGEYLEENQENETLESIGL